MRLNDWKTKPILRLRRSAARFSPRSRMRMPSRIYSPPIVAVEDAEDIQQCALSGAGSAHDGHQLAAGDIKVDILEHVQGHRPGVGFIYVFKMYHSKYAPIGSLAIKDAIVCRKLHSGEKKLIIALMLNIYW